MRASSGGGSERRSGGAPRPGPRRLPPATPACRRRRACTCTRGWEWSVQPLLLPPRPPTPDALQHCCRPHADAHSLASSSISSFFWHPVEGKAMFSCGSGGACGVGQGVAWRAPEGSPLPRRCTDGLQGPGEPGAGMGHAPQQAPAAPRAPSWCLATHVLSRRERRLEKERCGREMGTNVPRLPARRRRKYITRIGLIESIKIIKLALLRGRRDAGETLLHVQKLHDEDPRLGAPASLHDTAVMSHSSNFAAPR